MLNILVIELISYIKLIMEIKWKKEIYYLLLFAFLWRLICKPNCFKLEKKIYLQTYTFERTFLLLNLLRNFNTYKYNLLMFYVDWDAKYNNTK